MSTSHATHSVAKKRASNAQHGVKFLKEFLTQPGKVGAIAPTSARLCRKMIEGIDFDSARAIAEYGPGTGVLTDQIVPRLSKRCTFFAVELNPEFAKLWREHYPNLKMYNDSASNIAALCHKEGVQRLDVVFSGLPWASFPEELQREILDATLPMLKPGGKLITFAYQVGRFTPAGRRFAKLIRSYFSKIEHSEMVWRNIPPGFVIRCTK